MGSETATDDGSMQDAATRLESILFGEDEPKETELDEIEGKGVIEDDENLPDDDDPESKIEEGSEADEDGEEELELGDDEITLAGYLGIDENRVIVNEDGSVSVNTIIDGETKAVPLKELASSFQLQGHVNNQSIALSNERKEFEATRTTVANELKQRIEGIEQLSKLAEDQLIGEYNNIDWNSLRATDATEWTALRQEFSEKAARIEQTKTLAAQERQRIDTENQTKFDTQMKTHMAEEGRKLIAKNPTWSDPTVLQADMTVLEQFLINTYGYAQEDMESVTDSRLISVIQDARKYREGSKKAASKRTKKVPKFQKPGVSKASAKSTAKARGVKAKRDKVRSGGGKTKDIANLILDRM